MAIILVINNINFLADLLYNAAFIDFD